MNAPLPEDVRKALESVTLDDKYALETGRAFMSGVQALVRLPAKIERFVKLPGGSGGRERFMLLETLIGKVSNRLMQLPGVLGVRVKIAKLEIFEDCEVAIRMETGQW